MKKNIVAEIGRLLIEYEIRQQRKQKTASAATETVLDDSSTKSNSSIVDCNSLSNSILSQSNVK